MLPPWHEESKVMGKSGEQVVITLFYWKLDDLHQKAGVRQKGGRWHSSLCSYGDKPKQRENKRAGRQKGSWFEWEK